MTISEVCDKHRTYTCETIDEAREREGGDDDRNDYTMMTPSFFFRAAKVASA